MVGFSPPLLKLSFKLFCAARHRFLQLTLVWEREWNVELATHIHTRAHKTQAKLHCTGGGIVSVAGSEPQGYNGKAKNDRTCALLNILVDFATSCQLQRAGKGTQYHRFLSKSMAQPDMDQMHILALSFFPNSRFRSSKVHARISPRKR